MNRAISIFLVFISFVVNAEEVTPEIERTRIGEWLRASDIEPRKWAVDSLFKQGGILNYQTLKLLWVSESSPEIRNLIAAKFKNCRQCRFIPGDVLKYWQASLNKLSPEERATREKELADIFGT